MQAHAKIRHRRLADDTDVAEVALNGIRQPHQMRVADHRAGRPNAIERLTNVVVERAPEAWCRQGEKRDRHD
jgi:hypothetical protein